MTYQYIVILKKNSERTTDLLSILLCLFSALTFLYLSFHAGHLQYIPLIIGSLLLTGLAINLLMTRRSHNRIRYRYWLLLAAIGWIGITPIPWVGALFFLLAFLEYQTKRPLEIGFHYDRVVINTLIRRRFDWSVFNNVILKDGLLTLDFKNNRLVQKEVADEEDEDDADEEEFNAFCRDRLADAQKI
jgi:uncharacterized membrane protein YhaH (DUF805 family)